jgi:cellulose biosynthesis protein BcsQ
MRYAIWNNKGGVGKTFLTFVIACEYAAEHPDKNVIMLDLCPQANLSEIVLGGNGLGSDNLEKMIDTHRTIGGYFDERIDSPQKMSGNETSFLIKDLKKSYNKYLPSNVFLVAGDSSLEIQAQAISNISGQPLPIDTWSNVHKWLRDLIGAIEGTLSNSVFFIDCNPSFASYTELAILASERLIIPCSADGSSARAIDNVGRLVYGTGNADEYGDATFNKRAIKNHFVLPSIHVVTLNRSTQYDKKASKSFSAMFKEIGNRVGNLKKTGLVQFSVDEKHLFLDMPDAHSVAVVCSHEGVPLASLKAGPHKVHDTTVQVNPEPYNRYNECLKTLVSAL